MSVTIKRPQEKDNKRCFSDIPIGEFFVTEHYRLLCIKLSNERLDNCWCFEIRVAGGFSSENPSTKVYPVDVEISYSNK